MCHRLYIFMANSDWHCSPEKIRKQKKMTKNIDNDNFYQLKYEMRK